MKIIECRNLNKRIGNFQFDHISFELEEGYIMGVIGVNGAGKSTLLKALMGSVSIPKQTDIWIDGISIRENPKDAKQKLAFVLTDCPFAMNLTVSENMQLFAPLYDTWDEKKFAHWMRQFGLDEKQRIGKLSKGQQMKFQLAFALSYEAKIYFMDEPSANLDVEFREEFYQIMREIVAEGDKSILYVTQLVEELDGLADYILWMDKGKNLLCMDMETLQERFQIVTDSECGIEYLPKKLIIGRKFRESHNEALIDTWKGKLLFPQTQRRAKVEEIMYYFVENPSAMQEFLLERIGNPQQQNGTSTSRLGGGIYV
jgi:ABC-2 type transport system ATP-binding protein